MSTLSSIPFKLYSTSMATYRQNPSKFQMGFALSVICGTTLYFANKRFHFTTSALDLGKKVASYTYGPLGRLTNFDVFLTEDERRLKSLYQWKKAGGPTENRARACEILIESMSTDCDVPLDLSGLGLTSLPPPYFFPKEHLDLSRNNLGHFLLSHVDFLNKYTLKSLNLSHNNLRDSDPLFRRIKEMQCLEKLDLSNNRLTTAPQLNLSYHNINYSRDRIQGSLTHLNLSNNQLSDRSLTDVIPPQSLYHVDLSGNTEIREIRPFLEQLEKNCHLILTGTALYQTPTLTVKCAIDRLPKWLGKNLPHLRNLRFTPLESSYCAPQLKKFRESVADMPQLESLDISQRGFLSLPDLSRNPRLKELIARGNPITELPAQVNPRLKRIDLTGNERITREHIEAFSTRIMRSTPHAKPPVVYI